MSTQTSPPNPNPDYLQTVRDVYRQAAVTPQKGLCCTTSPVWTLPDLQVPERMLEMNYGCGTTVHPRDLAGVDRVAYVGVGGGLELLQFAYFVRRPGGVIGIDPVPEMLEACRENLEEAAHLNDWFRTDFVELRTGDALDLPLKDESVAVAAQNCLFNIFRQAELIRALQEMYRVLRAGGRLLLSDPICEDPIPERLRRDDRLRALCLSGALPLDRYLSLLTAVGFSTVEVRARRPYRVLDPRHFGVERLIVVESAEVCAVKDAGEPDGPCIFLGRVAIYFGSAEAFDDGHGHHLPRHQPVAVCEKTAARLRALGRDDLWISEPTYFYEGGGCC